MSDKLSEAMLLKGALDRALEELQLKNPTPFNDICKQLALMDKETLDEFPEGKSGSKYWVTDPLAPRDIFIEGVMERGDVASYNAPSKSKKSFEAAYLGLCLAGGIPWHGINIPKKRKVGYVNFELREDQFRDRVRRILALTVFDIRDMDNFISFNLKGRMTDTESLIIHFKNIITTHKFDILIIDPFYKFLNSKDRKNLDENSSSDMEYIICRLNSLTTLNCSILWTDHYTKSNRASLKAMDRMAGSGVKTREPDCVMSLTEVKVKEEEETDSNPEVFRLEFTTRGFRTPDPITLEWDYPLYRVCEEHSNAKLAGEGGRPSVKVPYDKLVALFNALRNGANFVPIEELGIGRSTLFNIIAVAKTTNSNTYNFKIEKKNLTGKAPYTSSPKTEIERGIESTLEGL